ncbi:MAG: hypothetical protein ACFFE4_21740 [Candidatus Thorarchaeota archaeon]
MMINTVDTEQIKKIHEIIELVSKSAGDIPIFLAVPDSYSVVEKVQQFLGEKLVSKETSRFSKVLFKDLSESYPLTEITQEVGPRGENAFMLLTKTILERLG